MKKDNSTYPGGKAGSGTYQTIINQIPKHSNYFELFAGAAAIFKYKLLADYSFLNDINPHVALSLRHKLEYNSLPYVVISSENAINFLQRIKISRLNNENSFIYLDPPYPKHSRKNGSDIYKCEMTDEEHIQLLEIIVTLKCNIALSTYPNDIYGQYLNKWRCIEFQSMTRRGQVTEQLWMNYPEPVELHDYRYLGTDYREREKIKRRNQRLVAKIGNLPPLERIAILKQLTDFLHTKHPKP